MYKKIHTKVESFETDFDGIDLYKCLDKILT